MCFSPEVDLVAGVAIVGIGFDTLRHVDQTSQRALASLPLAFGGHQIVEAVVWWSVQGDIGAAAGDWAAWAYLAVAFGLLPWFVPLAVRAIEPDAGRRDKMAALAVVGGAVSVVLMAAVIRGPVVVTDGGRYLQYGVPLSFGGVLVAAYVLATCGALLLSTHRFAAQFGAVNLVAVILLSVMLSSGFISLWCAWAAVVSVAIALHLRQPGRATRPAHRAGVLS